MTRSGRAPGARLALGATLIATILAAACRPGAAPTPPAGAEAVSLLGRPLAAPALDSATRARLEGQLAEARARLESDTASVDAAIWVGRRTAYLGRHREAIAAYTAALRRHPDEPRLLRHRGHRWLTVRELARAERDLAEAAALVRGRPDEVEPDGMPNARGVPTSTLQGNVWYHLGLARYLRGDWAGAARAWREGLAVAHTDDMRVASSYWLYLALRRAGDAAGAATVLAPVRADMDVIENGSYHRLLRLYRGDLPPDSLGAAASGATPSDLALAYGIGAWHLLAGRDAEARAHFTRIVEGGQWAAFGHLAAEAELARRR